MSDIMDGVEDSTMHSDDSGAGACQVNFEGMRAQSKIGGTSSESDY